MTGDDERRNELHATLHTLEAGEGADQELISLFIPPDKPLPEVAGYLRDEFSRAETSPVQHALSAMLTGLKKYDKLPGNGLALFCGAGPEDPGKDPHCIIIEPPEPLTTYLYRRSTKFELEPLRQMLDEKNLFGLLVLDLSGAWWGFLRGDRTEPAGNSTSSIPPKQRKGGQSSARFQRLREIAVNEFYSRVGNHASEAFMREKDFFSRFRGVLIGGPGMTKDEFLAGHFLHHEIQRRVIGLFDVATTGTRGLAELVEQAKAAISTDDVTSGKYLLGRFREERAKSDGLAISGEERVRKNLTAGAVGTLLLSSGLRISHRRITCQKCGHADERTIPLEPGMDVQGILARTCRICDAPVIVDEGVDITEELTRLADKGGAKTKIIAENFEEGSQFLVEYGGIGAILRYRTEF